MTDTIYIPNSRLTFQEPCPLTVGRRTILSTQASHGYQKTNSENRAGRM